MIKSFPKIFAIGTDYISRIFDGEVEVTEKLDGSQFVFGKVNGELCMRSKGAVIHDYHSRSEKDLFYPVIQHVLSIEDKLPDDTVFYGETLARPKHNTLKYGRTPKGNFMLFAVSNLGDKFVSAHETLTTWARQLDCEVVPLLYRGNISRPEQLLDFMKRESVLGEAKAEGVVVKNYASPFLLGGQPIPVMAGKYVSEEFKEVHRKNWTKENTGAGKWQLFKEGYCTEARWQKSVNHLKEEGELEGAPRDIGKLIAAVKQDITEEEQEAIKDFLWREFSGDLLRRSVAGFPEWYKKQLLENSFDKS